MAHRVCKARRESKGLSASKDRRALPPGLRVLKGHREMMVLMELRVRRVFREPMELWVLRGHKGLLVR
jgi:hypothetical protein